MVSRGVWCDVRYSANAVLALRRTVRLSDASSTKELLAPNLVRDMPLEYTKINLILDLRCCAAISGSVATAQATALLPVQSSEASSSKLVPVLKRKKAMISMSDDDSSDPIVPSTDPAAKRRKTAAAANEAGSTSSHCLLPGLCTDSSFQRYPLAPLSVNLLQSPVMVCWISRHYVALTFPQTILQSKRGRGRRRRLR